MNFFKELLQTHTIFKLFDYHKECWIDKAFTWDIFEFGILSAKLYVKKRFLRVQDDSANFWLTSSNENVHKDSFYSIAKKLGI